MSAGEVAEVLAAHQRSYQVDGDYGEKQWIECTCGGDYPNTGDDEADHDHHLAAALAPVIEARVAAAVAGVAALLDLWESWDGSRPHPGESSPRQREQLRAALAATDATEGEA